MKTSGERLVSPPRAPRGIRIVVGLGAVGLIAYVLHVVAGVGSDALFEDWVLEAVGLATIVVCAWRATRVSVDRLAWALVGLGIALVTGGSLYYAHVVADPASVPVPSPGDAFYLASYVPMYIAVGLLARRQAPHAGVGVWLDGLIAATAFVAVGAAVVLGPVMQATGQMSPLAAATNFAYPISDLVLLAMLIVPLVISKWHVSRSLALFTAAMIVYTVSDLVYVLEAAQGTYAFGGVIDIGGPLGEVILALAAVSLSAVPVRGVAPLWRQPVVPAVAGLAAVVVMGLQVFGSRNVASLVAAIVTLVLVIVRMMISLRATGVLLDARARDAVTDGLTGLPNRRALVHDLEAAVAEASEESPALLVIFDLDGFKAYNDTFGHLAGDALLTRIGASLRDAVGEHAGAYRMGGDEFCALVRAGAAEDRAAELATAMDQQGEGFSVAASYGCALIPRHGRDVAELMRRADDEMYARKGSRRAGAERQVQDVLLAALRERDPELGSHAGGVAGLAASLGRRLGVGATELRTLVHAAALHDIGKIAIPDGILHKPAPLDDGEQRFLRTHPLIAQRIVSAAPALGYAAQLVRSAQERWDGDGYPDGLRGEEIPLAARIIAVASAYQTLTSERALTDAEAIAELQRQAGTHFDPQLVVALVDVVLHPEYHENREDAPLAQHPVA